MLLADKLEEYQEHLKNTVSKQSDHADVPLVAYALARMAAISSQETIPWPQTVKWSELSAASTNSAWYSHVAGLANLRAGNLDKALEWLHPVP